MHAIFYVTHEDAQVSWVGKLGTPACAPGQVPEVAPASMLTLPQAETLPIESRLKARPRSDSRRKSGKLGLCVEDL